MKKQKWLSLLLCVAVVIMLLPATVLAAEGDVSYSYYDADSETWQTGTKAVGDYTSVTSADTSWSDGWYVVSGEVTISSRVAVSGDVHLILEDGCTLTADAGIQVHDTNALTIYGQTEGTGKLIANVTVAGNAAIGGNYYVTAGISGGNITIHGGTIEATSTNGAGIGGGYGSTGGSGGNITINGGTVTATGNQMGAGIGGSGGAGSGDNGGNITINGGTVIATGGGGAGIGGGYGNVSGGSGGNITITGGIIKATSTDGAGIGGGTSGGGTVKSDGTTTIDGGTVTAVGKVAFSVRPTVSNGLKTSSGASESSLTTVATADLVDATYTGNKAVKTETCSAHEGDTAVYKDTEHHTATCKWCGTEFEEAHTFDANGTCVCGAKNIKNVKYLDETGNEKTAACTILTADNISSYGTLTAGWYAVSGTVTASSRITVSGEVYLILMDGCNFTANGGIQVQDDDNDPSTTSPNALTIYGQTQPILDETGNVTNGVGKLVAQNVGDHNAGIGGSDGGSGGTITISGGNVTANGGEHGAGIGGAYFGPGGNITINGGTVTATGGYGSAGIGGGQGGSGGTITVNGGIVTANGGQYGAGTGGGLGGSGGTVTIDGGTVTAVGGNEAYAFHVVPSLNANTVWSIFAGETVDALAQVATPTDETFTASKAVKLEATRISVDITWTAMEFTYTNGDWSPETHSYSEGSWTTTGGEITLQNNSNIDVNAAFAYTPADGITGITGSFENLTNNIMSLSAGDSGSTKLSLSGKPAQALSNTPIGTVTITITNPQNP